MKTIKKFLAISVIASILVTGCSKETQIDQVSNTVFAFQPSSEVTVNHGMLAFETKADMDITMNEISASNRAAVDAWEKEMGIQTPANVFNRIIIAEDSVSKYYESLPLSEQDYWRLQPEVHSEIYKKALAMGSIREVKEADGNIYFDYNLSDNSMNGVVNSEGFVFVEGKIFQFTHNATKIILNGDFNLVPSLQNINEDDESLNILVHKSEEMSTKTGEQIKSGVYPGYTWTKNINNATVTNLPWPYVKTDWVYWNKNYKGNYTRRNRVWIDGHSEGTNNNPDCNSTVNCTYIIRAEYQELNFWGNWKYNSNQPFSMNASWEYIFGQYTDVSYGCGSSYDWFTQVPAYQCSGAQNCPTSPYNYTYPTVNNVFINLTPHGSWFSGTGPWFSHAFNVYNVNLTATLGDIGYQYN